MNKKRAQIVPEKIQAIIAPFFLENQSILTPPPHSTRKKRNLLNSRARTHNYALKEELYKKIINSRERGPPRKSTNNEEEREE